MTHSDSLDAAKLSDYTTLVGKLDPPLRYKEVNWAVVPKRGLTPSFVPSVSGLDDTSMSRETAGERWRKQSKTHC